MLYFYGNEMKLMEKKIDFDEALKLADIDNVLLRRQKNGMMLSNYQIDVLKKYDIDYERYSNMQMLLFDIEEILNDDYDEELDAISKQLAEFIYYRDTKK